MRIIEKNVIYFLRRDKRNKKLGAKREKRERERREIKKRQISEVGPLFMLYQSTTANLILLAFAGA